MKKRVMKKTLLLMVTAVLSIALFGCNPKEEYEVYTVVHYERNDKFYWGTGSSYMGRYSTVYFYSKRENAIQLQPEKRSNSIINVNQPWRNIKSIEPTGLKDVYYNNHNEYHYDYRAEYELINDSEIEVFKITVHENDDESTIRIVEFYVINVEDITAFEFDYKVDELE